jgi:hypothetical protein
MPKSASKRKKTDQPPAPESPPSDETPENLDKVRDILFGGQMRAVDQRLAALEDRFKRDLDNLRSDNGKRLSELETFFKKEIESLTKKLTSERSKRSDDLKATKTEMHDGFRSIEKQLSKLDDASNKADAELRTAILEHTQSVTEQIKSLSDQFDFELRQAVQELRGDKLDTATLVQMFTDMALHLSEDMQAESE